MAAYDGAGAALVIMLTREFWQTRFGGDPTIIGRVLHIGGKGVTVVGVLQSAPSFPQRIDAFMNMANSEHHVSATMVTGRTASDDRNDCASCSLVRPWSRRAPKWRRSRGKAS